MDFCPQCKNSVKNQNSRLIQDTCGHKKCRLCLLKEEDGCRVCFLEVNNKKYSEADDIPSFESDEETVYEKSVEILTTCMQSKSENDNSKLCAKDVPRRTEEKEQLTIKSRIELKDEERKWRPSDISLGTKNETSLATLNEIQIACKPIGPKHSKVSTSVLLKENENFNNESAKLIQTVLYESETDTKVYNKEDTTKLEQKIYKRHPLIPKSHIIIVQGNPIRYNCMACKKLFTSKFNVRYHNYCATENKPFHCDLCGKGFVIKSHYEYHQKIHTGDRPYGCDTCGKRFQQSGKLKRHLKCHTGEKPYICQDCGKDFVNNGSLRIHRRIHTGEKPHTCGDCGRAFTDYSNLKKHQMAHTGEKPFMCEECGKSFTFKGGLDIHQIIHTRERPYECTFCSRAFGIKKDLKRHLIVHSCDRPHSCSVCSVAFRRKDNLERHMKNTHPETRQVALPQQPVSNVEKGTSVIRDKPVVQDAVPVKSAESTIIKVQKTFQVPVETDKQVTRTIVFRPIIQLNSDGIKSTLKLPQPKEEPPPKKHPASRTSKKAKKQIKNKVEPYVNVPQGNPSYLETLNDTCTREVGTNSVSVFNCNASISEIPQVTEVQKYQTSQTGKQLPDSKLEKSIESYRAVPVINRPTNIIANITTISTSNQPSDEINISDSTKGKEQVSEGKNHVSTITRASSIVNATTISRTLKQCVNTIVKPKPKHKYYSINTAMPPPLISIATKTNHPIRNYKASQSQQSNQSVLSTAPKLNHPILSTVRRTHHPIELTRKSNEPVFSIVSKVNQPVLNIVPMVNEPILTSVSKVNQPTQPILRMLLNDVDCVDNERNSISTQENANKAYALLQDTSTNMSSSYDPKLSDVCSPDFLMQTRELIKAPTVTTITANSPFSTSDYDKRLGYSDDFSVDSQFRASYSQSSIYDSLMESSYMVDDVVCDKETSQEKSNNMSNTLSMLGQLAEYSKYNHIIQNTFCKNKEVGERLHILADVAGTKDAPFSILPIGQPVIVGACKGGNSITCSNLNL